MFDKKIFASRIYELRTKQSISQKQLGDAVGLSHKAISTLESANRLTSIERLIALADYFDVSLDYLVGRTDDPHRM